MAVLLLAGVAAIRLYGPESLLGLSLTVPEGVAIGIQSVLGWSLAVAACVGISSVFAFGRR